MERRAYKRIDRNCEATLWHDHQTSLVRVNNCSESGACIRSISGIFPCGMANVNLLIPVKKNQIKLFGKIIRVTKPKKSSYTIGSKFIKPAKKYLDFISTMKILKWSLSIRL